MEHMWKIDNFINTVEKNLTNANRFQKIFCMTKLERELIDEMGSYELLDIVGKFIDEIFEEDYNRLISKDDIEKLPYIIYVGFYILSELVKKINNKGD